MHVVLATVGTSLISNFERDRGTKTYTDGELLSFLAARDPAQATAETNSLSKMKKHGWLSQGDRIVFLHSETEHCARCATLLATHYARSGFETVTRECRDLSYRESHFKLRGLRSLVGTMVEIIRQERSRGYDISINATGGFKAEIAYATLVGLLFNVPVYYIHDAFKDIIRMPPTPITWDSTLISEWDDFLAWLSADLRRKAEVDAYLESRHVPQSLRLLLAEEENYCFLSPAGEAFYDAYKDALAGASTEIMLSRQAREIYARSAPDQQRLFDALLSKLRLTNLRVTGSDRVDNCDCLIFPKGDREGRLFYFEKDEVLYVCELSRHSDRSYERLISRGVRRANYGDYRPYFSAGA